MSEEATIRRGARNARYTAVPNQIFEDQRLSMEARWLLGYLLSKPDGWVVRLGDIRKRGGCGRDKARAMVRELVEAGYAEKEDARKDDGKFNGLSLVIYDEPKSVENGASSESVAFLPQTEKPATAEPSPVNPPLVNTESIAIPESSRERGHEREDQKSDAERRREVAIWLKRHFTGWPGYAVQSESEAIRHAVALSAEERDAAVDRMADYLAAEKREKARCAYSVYLAEKRWERLPPKQADPEKPVYAPAFGPVWGAIRMADLVTGPKAATPLKPWEERAVAEGALDREPTEREKRRRLGWPKVNAMDAAAETRGIGVTAPKPAEVALGALMEPVPVVSPLLAEWRAEFERQGWPWLPDPGRMPVIYFPAGGPAALGEFEQAVRGGHDGRRPEAAE